MRKQLLMFAAGLLGGCATNTAAPAGAECRPLPEGRFVGQQASSELAAQMLRESGARVIRWVSPGMMVTMEFRADRLTVRLDSSIRVASATCG